MVQMGARKIVTPVLCRNLLSVVLVGVSFLGAEAGTTSEDVSLPNVRDDWIEASSTHFTVISNAGRRKTVRVTSDLEELRSALVRRSSREPVEGVPTVVYLFDNDTDFTPFKYLENGEPAAVSGFFRATPQANLIALDGRAGYDSGVVFHEYVHCWMSKTPGRMPLWVEEGLAELFQTFSVSGDRIQYGKPIGRHLAWFRNHPLIPLELLLAVGHDDPLYRDESLKSGFYAESWALVHLLVLGDPERAPQLQQYLALLAQGSDQLTAFERAFEGGVPRVEKQLGQYVRKKVFKIFSFDLEIGPTPDVLVRSLSRSEVSTRLGELLLSEQPPRPEAGLYFEHAVVADEKSGAALAGLAQIAEAGRNWREADALYDRALAAAPDDPKVLYLYGDSLISGRGDAELAVRLLQKSVKADPGFGPAWSVLTDALLEAGSPAEAVLGSARTAHLLLPYDRDATWDLLEALVGAGHWDEARTLVDSAFPETAFDRQRAIRLLVHRGLEKTHQLIALEECEQASDRCDWAASQVAGADDVQFLEAELERARSAVTQCRLEQRFRAAAAMYEEGLEDDAITEMSAIADSAPDSDLGRRASRFIDRAHDPGRGADRNSSIAISSISSDELDLLNQRLVAGDLESALEMLLELRDRSGPSESAWVNNKINEVRGALAHNRYVEDFNRAVDFFNSRDFPAAVAVLERVVREMPEGIDTSSARSLLVKARAAMEQ